MHNCVGRGICFVPRYDVDNSPPNTSFHVVWRYGHLDLREIDAPSSHRLEVDQHLCTRNNVPSVMPLSDIISTRTTRYQCGSRAVVRLHGRFSATLTDNATRSLTGQAVESSALTCSFLMSVPRRTHRYRGESCDVLQPFVVRYTQYVLCHSRSARTSSSPPQVSPHCDILAQICAEDPVVTVKTTDARQPTEDRRKWESSGYSFWRPGSAIVTSLSPSR